jgi:Fe-S-cluster containining protein
VFSHDLEALRVIGKDGEEFVKEIKINGKNVKTLKKKNNSSSCVFWDENKEMCSIYKNRPFDCRAYPFDIYFIDGKYHWIVYSCNPKSEWQWTEKYLQMLENDKQFNEVMEKIDVYSDLTQINKLEKSKQYPFTVLREVRCKTNFIL